MTTTHSDLTQSEQILFRKIENIYINHRSITRQSFVRVLGVLIQKHRVKNKR